MSAGKCGGGATVERALIRRSLLSSAVSQVVREAQGDR